MDNQQHVSAPDEDMQRQMDAHNQRLLSWYNIEEQTWSDAREVVPGSGIWVYEDVIPKSLNVINRLEDVLGDPNNSYNYSEALVGYGVKMPEYRDCFDFKYKKSDIAMDTSESGKKLSELWDDTHYRQLQAVKDYTKRYNIGELRYWEATNFVKYGPKQHFQEHHDHGYSYNCVVSLVAFPNDDYEGGELAFSIQKTTIKAKAGDLYVFPSNFMYPHRAMPIVSGTKYSMVTMLDYSDKYHRPEFYGETES
jgi:hypothetical protein